MAVFSSVVSVNWPCLGEAGRLASVGDGNGDASFDPVETVMGSGFFDVFCSEPRSASFDEEKANVASVILPMQGARQLQVIERGSPSGSDLRTCGINGDPVMYDPIPSLSS